MLPAHSCAPSPNHGYACLHAALPRPPPQDAFLERHGVKLGFMSAFVKAAGAALQYVPAVNGVIDGSDIIYRWAGAGAESGGRLAAPAIAGLCCAWTGARHGAAAAALDASFLYCHHII